mmetsp:Transcript_109263/g.308239  ORF Transcript_109263/g.308239 Transcript_109263/m.308239 type:complete len:218 (-) Transcript_109263:684-1337(-)
MPSNGRAWGVEGCWAMEPRNVCSDKGLCPGQVPSPSACTRLALLCADIGVGGCASTWTSNWPAAWPLLGIDPLPPEAWGVVGCRAMEPRSDCSVVRGLRRGHMPSSCPRRKLALLGDVGITDCTSTCTSTWLLPTAVPLPPAPLAEPELGRERRVFNNVVFAPVPGTLASSKGGVLERIGVAGCSIMWASGLTICSSEVRPSRAIAASRQPVRYKRK